MQDFTEQAIKNGVTLLDKGKCQFCGANYKGDVFECMEIYNNKVLLFDYNIPEINQTRFLIVDTHALQHSELHGRWNNHLHLTRLCLLLEKKVKWDYKKTPLLSDFINEYKKIRMDEILIPPSKLERGKITTKDISLATSTKQYIELVQHWAEEVYHAWALNHLLVSKIADGFFRKTFSTKIST
jgi:ribosomal protein S18